MRNYVVEAVILRKYRIGEIHKGLRIFSRENGLINVIAHGAYKMKNRFRIITEPFIYSKMYIYHNPVRDTNKLQDIEPIDLFEEIRKSIVKYYTASLWAEFIIDSKAGGNEYSELFDLFVDALKILDGIEEKKAIIVSLGFLIRMIHHMGFLAGEIHCSSCGKKVERKEDIFFSPYDASVRCRICRNDTDLKLTEGAVSFLYSSMYLPLEKLKKGNHEISSLLSLKRFVYAKLESLTDTVIKSIKSSEGIL